MKTSLRIKTPFISAAVVAAALITAACGGGDDDKSKASDTTVPATTATTTATTTTGSAKATVTGDLASAFGHIAGYELGEVPASQLQQAREQYETEVSGNAAAEKAVTDLNGRTVSKDGEQVAVVLALAFNPEFSTKAGFHEGFVQGAAGDDSSPVRLSGESARTFTQSDGTEGVVFAKGRLGLIVIGDGASSTDLQDIMSKLIGNNV